MKKRQLLLGHPKRKKLRKKAIAREVKRLTNAIQKEQRTNRRLAKLLVKFKLRRGRIPYKFADEG